MLTQLKSLAMSLPRKEASLSRQGFPGMNSPSRAHLETVLGAFVDGYNMAIAETDTRELVRRLDGSFPPEYLGFAYEGTGLYFAVMDLLLPGRISRLDRFTHGDGASHDYIAMVGAGFAIARVPFALHRLESYQKKQDEFTAFCLADGYGFHEGFFRWKSFLDGRKPSPASLNPQNRLLYDSGVARAMWWVYGADPVGIAQGISRFAEDRRPEMWAGIGVAMSYASAGPGNPDPSSKLVELAGPYRYDLLSGIPFSAHMRWKGGNSSAWTERACSNLLGMSLAEASGMVTAALDDFVGTWKGPVADRWAHGYVSVREHLRQRIESSLQTPVRSAAAS